MQPWFQRCLIKHNQNLAQERKHGAQVGFLHVYLFVWMLGIALLVLNAYL